MNLVVYASNSKVGILDMRPNEPFYGFTYDESFLESPNATQLSLSLPLRSARFDGWHALPFFEGLLPEGDVRAAVARQLGISERSPAKLLRALGRDCAGDVAVLEEDDPYQPPAKDAYGILDEGLSRIARNPFGEISRLRAGNRLSLAGGQEKIALYHDKGEDIACGWYVPLKGSPSTHIVKPQLTEAYPQLVYNEYFCMRLAHHAGFACAQVQLIEPGRPLLVIARFDRTATGESNPQGLALYSRIHQEDFCQALGFDSSRKYENDGGPGIADMCNLVLTHSAHALADRDSLLRLAFFNYIIGNCDAHAKNYSMLLGKDGHIRLAPAYDIVSTAVYDGEFGAELSRGMGMKIGDHSHIDRITSDDFALLASNVGMAKELVLRIVTDVLEKTIESFAEAKAELQDSAQGDTSELITRIQKGVEKRAEVIATA